MVKISIGNNFFLKKSPPQAAHFYLKVSYLYTTKSIKPFFTSINW